MVGTSIKMMNAAAPRRDAPAAVQLQKIFLNLPAPPCLGEVLRRAILQKYPYFAEKFHQ
jgi:hypothetical protein